ncbi:TetR/AcrR family transcriptional regulator [Rhodococcus sp. 1168]|uniref:TetR/AcrR family transcriptional regulator n=1 Tax=Rhodococcus sp. 1168 TaxID=2018041 RepID=UPI000A0D92C5|nr:helix-turn-helix domain-containing protein [Rhodococcus sp. 1168]ORI24942.1 hypothetical protein BJI47_05580 [Rhodococcus sp. 1168]
MPTNATVNAELRKRQVLHTATPLFAENGLAGTSMRMIASSIGMLPSSLYPYVPSKESLLEEIVIGHLRAMNTEFHRVVDRSLAASNHRLWIASLQREIDEDVYRPSIAPNVAYELIKDGLWLTGRWFRPTPEYTLADLSVECVEFHLNALMPKQSPP